MISISNKDFDGAVAAALAAIPPEFQRHLENVVIEVHRQPDRKLLEECEMPDDLLGLYLGVPLEDKGPSGAESLLPDRVLLFRDNLCDMCDTRDELIQEIRITLLHEIGHHFGMDEDRLAELGYE